MWFLDIFSLCGCKGLLRAVPFPSFFFLLFLLIRLPFLLLLFPFGFFSAVINVRVKTVQLSQHGVRACASNSPSDLLTLYRISKFSEFVVVLNSFVCLVPFYPINLRFISIF